MTRKEAIETIYEVINSGIISEELEGALTKVCNRICDNSFEKCRIIECGEYCEDCEFLEDDE